MKKAKKNQQVLVNVLTARPKPNRKLRLKWEVGDTSDECLLVFERMLHKGEDPETSTCYTEHRLGAKFTGIHLSNEIIPDIIDILIKYLEDKK